MADKNGTPLADVEGFSPELTASLAGWWITTAEEFIAAVEDAGMDGMADALGVSSDQLATLLENANAAAPDFTAKRGDPLPFPGLGSLDEPEGLDPSESTGIRTPLPLQANLIVKMPPVRNQQGRGTCVAHACAAVREYLLGEDSTEGDLSEQFLYWAAKQRDGYPGEGTWIKTAMAVLEDLGICAEAVWPYNPAKIAGNEGQGPPPADAAAQASPYRIAKGAMVEPRWVDDLKEVLSKGKPVAFAVPVYSYWLNEPVRTSGAVRMPLATDKSLGGHAMCMVGYQDDATVPGGGYFLVRNSWGKTWSKECPEGAGYCRVPYAYLAQLGRSAYTASVPQAEPATPPTPTPTPRPPAPKPTPPPPKPTGGASFLDWLKKIFQSPPRRQNG